MNEDQSRKRNLVFLIVGVLVLLLVIIGATYAFFQAQIGTGKEINADVSTGTTDNLTFSMSDINRNAESDNETNVLDEENEKTDIVINANQKNFGSSNISLGDGVKATATLKANDTTNNATATYNVFFVMDNNNLKYTTKDSKPELILTVIDPNGNEITSGVPGLKYHKKDETNDNDVSGFDITGKTKAFAIAQGYTIEAKAEEGGKKEQTWQIKVTLVNLKEDQNDNADKEITGRVVITTGTEKEIYTLPSINTITPVTTTGSIDATLNITEGTNEIEIYYFAIEEKGKITPTALSEKSKEEIKNWETEETNHHTFNDLTSYTNYIIYSYVVDSEGFESDLYETELVATNKTLPEITSLEVTSKSYNEISVKIESKEGDRGISGYEYEISGAGINEPRIEKDTLKTHTFENLSEQQQYTIKVRAVDKDGDTSADSVTTGETRESYYHETCNDESGACKIAKLSVTDNAIIFHEGFPDYERMPNSDLEAKDLSYRYVGSNFKLTSADYTGIDNDLIKFNCDGEEIKLTSYCPKPNRYYYLAYEPNSHFSYYYEVVDKALKEGYIEYDLENYVCFGADDCSNTHNYDSLYRIIGVFKNEKTNNYEIKLIKADYATIDELGKDAAFDQNFNYSFNSNRSRQLKDNFGQYFWNSISGATNDWTTSNLNKINLNTNFINYLNKIDSKWSLYINSHNWKLSAIENTNLTPKEAYNLEINNSLETPETNIGMLYLSEYGYSTSPEMWTTIFWNYSNYNSMPWLYMGNHEWTMSKSSLDSAINSAINILSSGSSSGAIVQNSAYPIRQTFYLKPDVKITAGEGTISNPYRLSLD